MFPGFKVWPQLKLILFVSQLTGGTASMQQLKERIEKELLEVRVLCFMLFKFMKVCFVLWDLVHLIEGLFWVSTHGSFKEASLMD